MSEKTKSIILMAASVVFVVLIIWFAGARRDVGDVATAPDGDGATSTGAIGEGGELLPDLTPPDISRAPDSEYAPAPSGEIPAEFPRRLLLGAGAKIEQGYTINYEAGFIQNTAEYNSSDSIEVIFNKFKNYFSENGWTVTNEAVKESGSRGLYAEKGEATANVFITKPSASTGSTQTSGSNVSVSYVEAL